MGALTILGLISGVLKLLHVWAQSAQAEKFMGAGEARALARSLKGSHDRIVKARAARRAVKHDPNSVRDDPRNRD